jgi:hypothetical protein
MTGFTDDPPAKNSSSPGLTMVNLRLGVTYMDCRISRVRRGPAMTV